MLAPFAKFRTLTLIWARRLTYAGCGCCGLNTMCAGLSASIWGFNLGLEWWSG